MVIQRVLVANRGEIAVRVMRTCHELGLETVAVFSDADRRAGHVLMANHAVHIGPPAARESYLVIDKILAAAAQTGADAIHPGYGFLSENPEFARACADAGITFIGPSGDSMRAMGSKTQARAAMQAAEVPVVPGNNGPDGDGFPDVESATEAADAIGFPVLIKAAAGGGGKGMRLVEDATSFKPAFEAAKREAASAFGDDTVYIEKAIIRPRHVEIQVFANNHGNVVHLGERDCSIQRRHQKVIEESPSPVVSPELRAEMGSAAVRAAQACDYRGAGTVEFLVAGEGDDQRFYFLEMNARLQVEHPVTEIRYGIDLVAWQILVANGEPLPYDQKQLDAMVRGCAVECRVYAEDPLKFLPSPGIINELRVPAGPYVRDDSGVYAGAAIPMFYDPLISKLIVWGATRDEAVARMRRAIDEYRVGGIRTNLIFHSRVLRHPDFCAGVYDTGFIAREAEALLTPTEAAGDQLALAVAAAAIAKTATPTTRSVSESADVNGSSTTGISPWRLGTR